MSTLKVDAIRHNSATSDAITTASDGTCTARITGMTGGGGLSHRNLIINGSFLIAQRATTSTSDNYQTVDRFGCSSSGTDEAPTQAQGDVSSSDTPFTLGLTKAFKITNGNQTSGAGASDYMRIRHRIEAQDVRNSGWNYRSSSSYITLSFWVKSSVAQTFYINIRSYDGTGQAYAHPFSATTSWTKITHSIPGNSNLDFANDSGMGLEIQWAQYYGTQYTDNSRADNTWAQFVTSTQTKDHTSTWYTTNDATFEITGVQLEVGDSATSFEHRSRADELARCQRYFYRLSYDQTANRNIQAGFFYSATNIMLGSVSHPVEMRAAPTLEGNISGTNYWIVFHNSANQMFDTIALSQAGTRNANFYFAAGSGFSTGTGCHVVNKNSPASCHFSAEL